MKKNYFLILFLSFSLYGYAQVGIGTETPNVHAVLELKAPNNNQGFIVPSLTTAQRTAAAFTSSLSASDNGLLVFDKQENSFYYWQNNAWKIIVSGAVAGGATGPAGGDLAGNYPNPQLAPNAVTAAKIADGTITDIKIVSVAPAKLLAGGATTGQVLKWNGTNWTAQPDNTGGAGTITNIATGTGLTGGPITSTGTISIADNGVTTVKIIDNAVTTAKIADGGVSNIKISDNAITSNKVSDGTIVTADLADNAVTSLKILDNAVITNKINNDAVTSAKIANATIVTADLADASVSDIKITAVAPSKLLAGGAATGQVLKWSGTSWTAQADITGGSGTVTSIVTGAGLTGGPVTTAGTISLADNGVTTVKIIDNAVTTTKIIDNAITTAKIADATIATVDLANGSVTDVKIASVATSKLTAGTAISGQVLKYDGTNWTPQNDAGGSGTVTSIATAGGLTGGPVTAIGTISIADGGVTSVKIADGSLVDADINATAGIVDTKLATISTAGKVSGNAITSGTISGSTAMNTSGAITTTSGVTATTSSRDDAAVSATSTGAGGNAVYAYSTAGGRGVWGYSPSGVGVQGESNTNYGVFGSSVSNIGVYGLSTSYIGVYGRSNLTTGSGFGVYGSADGSRLGEFHQAGNAVYGYNSYSNANGYIGGLNGVYGYSGSYGYGVQGVGNGGAIAGHFSSQSGYGIYATSNTTHAGFFFGSVEVTNGFTVSGGVPRATQSTFTIISDRRTKKDIAPFTDGLSTVLNINPVTFKYNGHGESENNGKEHIGIIAQEMLTIAPYMVQVEQRKLNANDVNKTDMFVFDASSLGFLLVNAIKEQQHEIEQQQKKIDALQQTVDELLLLKQKITELETYVKRASNKEAKAHINSN